MEKKLDGGYTRTGLQYDAFGRIYRATAPCDLASCIVYWTTNSYDAMGRVTKKSSRVSLADSSQQETTLAYLGAFTQVTDPLSRTTKWAKDPGGLLRQSINHEGNGQTFGYDSFGSLTGVSQGANILFSATYDYGSAAFRRTAVDMDLGSSSYVVNALGEIKTHTDNAGSTFSYEYDALSRPTLRTVAGEGNTSWNWGNSSAARNIGQLESLTSVGGTTQTYQYDTKGRLKERDITADGTTYAYEFSYNATTGLLDTMTYPATVGTRLKLQYGYQNGLLKQISNFNATSTVYWQAGATNPRGQLTQEILGNGVQIASNYDPVTGFLSTLQSGVGGGSGLQNESYAYDKLGNLTQRKNVALSLTEDFYYDTLYRLDSSKLNGVTNLDVDYDSMGNITKRCEPTCAANPTWGYDASRKHAVLTAPVGSTTYTYGYDANGNVNSRNGYSVGWNKYNYPTLINGPGESIALSYDADHQRWKQVLTPQSGSVETTLYIGGLLDKVTTGSTTEWRHSIQGGGKKVALVTRSSSGTDTTRYFLDDHQGSISKILNSSGSQLIAENFSAFGGRRNPTMWSGAPAASDLNTISGISRDGYTGHTALGKLGLNHMNGRVQDALTGRFLSPDPYVPDPRNTEDFNRYSYVRNNPLSYTDPSGFYLCPNNSQDDWSDLTSCPDAGGGSGDWSMPIMGGDFGVDGGIGGGGGGVPSVSAVSPDALTASSEMTVAQVLQSQSNAMQQYWAERRVGSPPGFANGGTASDGLTYDASGRIVGELGLESSHPELIIAGGAGVLRALAVGLRAAFAESGASIVARTAQQIASQGEQELLRQVPRASAAAVRGNPALARAEIGTYIHVTTAERLAAEYPGRFIYRTIGPDFYDTVGGGFVELTTVRSLAEHSARYAHIDAIIDYAIYGVP